MVIGTAIKTARIVNCEPLAWMYNAGCQEVKMEILVEFRSKGTGVSAGRRAVVELQQFCFGQGGR
jgi:hypothetical protein